jgi:hypothetical protein
MAISVDSIERFLSHGILWGVVALVALAVAFSGRFSMTASSMLIWAAAAMASFGIYRTFASQDWLLRALIVCGSILIFSALAVAANRWLGKKTEVPLGTSIVSPVTPLSIPPPAPPTLPEFVLSANGLIQVGLNHSSNSQIFFMLVMDFEVINRGAAGSAMHWSIHYVDPSINSTALIVPFGENTVFSMPGEGRGLDLILRKSDSIIEKTTTPIPQGAIIKGKLVFLLPAHESNLNLEVYKSTIEVSCEDYTGKKYSTTVTPGR